MKNLTKTLLAVLALTAATAACADGPMAPEADLPLAAAFAKGGKGPKAPDVPSVPGGDVDPNTVVGSVMLQWITPLAQDITVFAMCESNKPCTLNIEEIDVKLVIPRNALDEATQITMTAVAGAEVNFVFGPHGTQFNKPIKVSVGQEKTDAGPTTAFLAFYWVDGIADVREVLPALLKQGKIEFYPTHFSGYVLGM